jgi:phospholipid N-methyltransferase
MKHKLSELQTFFREFRRSFETTGAIAPSGRSLARSICLPISEHRHSARILEVGPGTGAVTQEIVRHVGPSDHFDLVELNESFVEALHYRFEHENSFRKVRDRTTILHKSVQEIPPEQLYDYIICGVPFNNFSTGLVREIMRHLTKLLKPGGTLSFFEYLWIRRIKVLLAARNERRRLTSVGRVLERYLDRYEFACQTVWVNFPPALAHHMQLETTHKHGGSKHKPLGRGAHSHPRLVS